MFKKQYSSLLILGLLLVGAWTMSGCSESTSPQRSSNNMSFTTRLGQSTITPNGTTGKFEVESHGARVDSLKVTYVGMIVSGLKMHMISGVDDDDTSSVDDDDTSSAKQNSEIQSHDHGNGKSRDDKHGKGKDDDDDDDDDIIIIHLDNHHDGTIISGPYLLEFDSAGTHLVTRATIPAGVYDRIKFEIHKIRGSANDSLLNDSAFVQFLSNDATIIIKGYVWDDGVMYPFTYYSRVQENLQVFFEPPLVIDTTLPANISLTFEPSAVFTSPFTFGRPIDPRDPDNRKHIEAAIKLSFKMAKLLN